MQIRALHCDHVIASGRKIVQLQQALSEIEQFHQVHKEREVLR